MPNKNPNNLDSIGAYARPCAEAARQAVDLFFKRVFPTTLANRYPVEESRDLEEDLRELFVQYSLAIMKAEYERLADDNCLAQQRSEKADFGPQHRYYERRFIEDDEDEDEDESVDDSASVDLEDPELAAADEAEDEDEDEDEDDEEDLLSEGSVPILEQLD